MSGLDPRSPLVLDTRELGRRPGAMRRVRRAVPAPDDLGVGGVVGVPPGADVELDLRLEAVVEGVLVSGTARAPLSGECVRCLDPVDGEVSVDLQELYAYPDRVPDDGDGSDGEDADLRVEDERVDLEPALRDAVVLALPLAPVCRDDCPGLCPECGARLADDPSHGHDETDPRWAALAGLRGAAAGEGTTQDMTTQDMTTQDMTTQDMTTQHMTTQGTSPRTRTPSTTTHQQSSTGSSRTGPTEES